MREFQMIQKFVRAVDTRSVVMGAGDDCSVVEYDKDHFLLGTVDSLVEGVHFLCEPMTMSEIGFKSLAVSLSDIWAMGGQPQWAHLSLAIPQNWQEDSIEDFFSGFYALADQWGVSLLGGDMVGSPKDFFVNVHVQGLVKKQNLKTRADFAEAEVIAVTGPLGSSSAGLEILLSQGRLNPLPSLVQRHFCPPLRGEMAQWLGGNKSVKGMMDLSDGLWSDLERLGEIGIQIQCEEIPIEESLVGYCGSRNKDPLSFALAGGEDYELLVGCRAEDWPSLEREFIGRFGQKLFRIGKISKDKKKPLYFKKGLVQNFDFKSFSHFSGAND